MRILTIVRNLGPGGTQRSAQSHAVAYRDAGVESAVLAYISGGPRAQELAERNIETFIAGEHGFADALRDAAAWKPEAVHVHRVGYADPATDGMLGMLRDAGARAVIETNHFARADRGGSRSLIDVHVQISRWCLWQWRRRCRGLDPAPLGVAIPHIIRADRFGPVAPDRRAAWRAEHGIPGDAVLFGRIGQPNLPSWSPVLLDAFSRVAGEDDRAWLVTVGLPEPLHARRDALPESVRRRIVSIDFLHGDDALRACYGSLDVFAHASMCGETFGMVICEAALAGVPTVTLSTPARANSQVEVVGHERGGLVAGDRAAFADAMRRMLRDPDLRARTGAAAAEWVREHCDAARITATLLRAFEAVVDAGGDRARAVRAVREIPGLADEARREDLAAMLAGVQPSRPLRDRVLMAASTYQSIGRIKHRILTGIRRVKAD